MQPYFTDTCQIKQWLNFGSLNWNARTINYKFTSIFNISKFVDIDILFYMNEIDNFKILFFLKEGFGLQ